MRKYKIFPILILMALTLMVSACGVKGEDDNLPIELEEATDEDIGLPETQDDAIEGDGETGGGEDIVVLEEDDAYNIVNSVLIDETFSAESYGYVSPDDENSYYVFLIKKDGTALSQKLAVNDVSGEIFVYDEDLNEFKDLSEFEYYSPANDESVDWNGTYINKDYVINIEMTDPGNFQYSVKKGLFNVAEGTAFLEDYTNAKGVVDEEEIKLSLSGDELSIFTVTGNCKFSGVYNRK